jgi:hypothetical protein
MSITDKTNNYTSEQIQEHENELKGLLKRVMEAPLEPLLERLKQMERRLKDVEEICITTQDEDLPSVRTQISEEVKKIRIRQDSIGRDIQDLLTDRLASMPQDLAQLREVQTLVKTLLFEVRQGQQEQGQKLGESLEQCDTLLKKSLNRLEEVGLYAKTAAEQSDKAVVDIGESHQKLGKALGEAQIAVRNQAEQLGKGGIAQIQDLRGTFAHMETAVSALANQISVVGTNLEQRLNIFEQHLENARRDDFERLRLNFKQRLLWVTGMCVIGLSGTAWLLVKSLT